MLTDNRGLPVTAANAEAVALFDTTVTAYCGLRSDTGDCLKRALAADPDFVLAHALKGYFMMLFGKRDFVARAERARDAAKRAMRAAPVSERERQHVAALGDWIGGDLHNAVVRWEAILLDHPRDLVALKLAQYGTFYMGDSAGMRASTGRVLPAWDEAVPGYGFVLGCHGFSLEEAGDYGAAERAGRRAVELNPADVWAAHAVAHVMEMQGRARDGIAWIGSLDREWDATNNFVFHIRWHRCLFYLDLERYDTVLELYDREVRRESTDEYLDITNAVALLWRLEQSGVDVGARWAELAERSASHIDDHLLVFADLHYVMALAAVGDREGVARWLQSSRDYAAVTGETQAGVMKEVGLALGEATIAHRSGDWPLVVDLLQRARPETCRIGGSHAQRDLYERMLIDAALRGGRPALALAMLSDRRERRPDDLWGWKHTVKAAEALGDAGAAETARTEAARLLAG